MTQDIGKLAARIEATTGPDRELDAEIAYAIDWGTSSLGVDHPTEKVRYLHEVARNSFADIGKHFSQLPRYTALIDAAMTLVRKDSDWMLDNFDGPRVGTRCSASVFVKPDWIDAFAATPALALCAASLRARHAIQKGQP